MNAHSLELPHDINPKTVPQHVAIIMDGNGRWAKQQGKTRIAGHREGVEAAKRVVKALSTAGVQYVTLYAFSTENWKRPALEVSGLMDLLMLTLKRELKGFMKEDFILRTIGDIEQLPSSTGEAVKEVVQQTKDNKGMVINVALSYGGRWEIVETVKQLATKAMNGEIDLGDLDEGLFSQHLQTADMPDPDLLIRSSGERRLSNFLVWQAAYSEYVFDEAFWPEFDEHNVWSALRDFQGRSRRFGTSSDAS